MAGCDVWTIVLLVIGTNWINCLAYNAPQSARCKTPTVATQRIEKVIAVCQEEIKLAILKEALKILGESRNNAGHVVAGSGRTKRELFSEEEQRIAGCLLQCVYKKVKAVDSAGFPTVEGLVKLYTEGITERGYFLATAQAVQQCLYVGYQQRLLSLESGGTVGGEMCDLAYKVFDCVSDQLASYCSGA